MNIKTRKDFLKKSKIEYNKIKSISCPAFGCERIFFNRQGFNHLIRKGSILRNTQEQKVRISLIMPAVGILTTSNNFVGYRETKTPYSSAKFWLFEGIDKKRTICVVIRQINEGNKIFFSVFKK